MKKIIILGLSLYVLCLAQEVGAKYLIITHDTYYDAIIPLAEWKTRKGIKAKIVRLSEIGSDSTEIKSYVTNAYNNWQIEPEYLLLVGNKYQLPFPRMTQHSTICHSDNYYTNVVGDFRNEIIPGRFWVNDTIEAKTAVAKVLGYEKNPLLQDPLWFRKGVTIVNEYEPGQPPSDSVYWADARYAHELMNNAGFVHIDSFAYSFGHNSSDVIDAINNGRSYILYRGLGFSYWEWPFDGIYTNQMYNGFKLPIVISATCATVEGIGCEWMNAGTPEEPRGVVGFFGTTTGLFEAAEFRSALTKGTLKSIFCDSSSTLGKAAESGRLKYYELFGNTLEYDSWNCLGDPEMTVWTTTPKLIQVSHTPELYTKICTVYVNVQYNSLPVESALVCMMAKQDSIVYHYGRTNNSGDIEFIGDFHVPGDSVFVTVTGRNLKPYCGLIMVNFFGGPYVLLYSFSILDTPGGNGDFIANPGEDIEIPVWVKNRGDSTAYNVSAKIQKPEPDSFFYLNDTIKYFGDIAPLDSAYTSDNGYNVIIAPDCPDTHQIALQLVISDANDSTWISDFDFTVHAPIILLNDYYFPGYLKSTPAGDTNQLIIEFENIGSYKAENVIGQIFCNDSFFIIIDSVSSFGTIIPDSINSNQSNPFVIRTDSTTPLCHPVDINLIINAGVYIDTFEFTVYVGQKDFLVWDPDLNHTSGPIIKTNLDTLNFYGDYITTFPCDSLSLYKSLFICCGIYPNNYIIRDTSRAAQDIELYLLYQGGKVYLEGGDVWFADPLANHGYDFCPLFDIARISNTIGLFPGVTGINGTFTQDMLFTYEGETTMIDCIDSTNGSSVIFRNTHNNLSCGVAANHTTVGLSFELGGLIDTISPSTKLILIDSIMKYFGIPPTGIKEYDQIINEQQITFSISPNPFRKLITLKLQIPRTKSQIALKIYDVSGRLVRSFNLASDFLPLTSTISWNGTDDNNRRVAEGVYFVRLVVDRAGQENYQKTEKIIFLK
jgi:hypothetical protein